MEPEVQDEQPRQWTDQDVERAAPHEVLEAMRAGLLEEHLHTGSGRDRRGMLRSDYSGATTAAQRDDMARAHRMKWNRRDWRPGCRVKPENWPSWFIHPDDMPLCQLCGQDQCCLGERRCRKCVQGSFVIDYPEFWVKMLDDLDQTRGYPQLHLAGLLRRRSVARSKPVRRV